MEQKLTVEQELELLEEFFSEDTIEEFTGELSEDAFSELVQVMLLVKSRMERYKTRIKELEEKLESSGF